MSPLSSGQTPRRNTLGDISVLYVATLLRAVEAAGSNAVALMSQFGLNAQLLESPDARISIPRYMRLGQAAINLTGSPDLGLTIGELTRTIDAGLAGLAAQAAPTAGTALETIIQYSPLTSRNSRGQPIMVTGTSLARFYSIRPYNAFNFFVVDSVLAAWVQLLRELTDEHHVVEQVWIEYPSQGMNDRFAQWFDCPIHFGAGENAIQLAPGIHEKPTRQAQPAMHRQLVSMCERDLARIQSGWSLRDRVKDKLMPLLEQSPPRLEDVAAEFGLSPWTLQRKLAREGTGYRQLIDETRQGLGNDYVRDTTLTFSEISWLLGFSTPAAFQKAYRRWFDVSPGEHRKQDRSPQNAPEE